MTAEKNQVSEMPPGSSGMLQQSNRWLKGILGSRVGPVCCSAVFGLLLKLCCFSFSTGPCWNKTISIIRRGYGRVPLTQTSLIGRIEAVSGTRVSFCTRGRVGAGTSDGWGNVCPGVPAQRVILKHNFVQLCGFQICDCFIFWHAGDLCHLLGILIHCRGV